MVTYRVLSINSGHQIGMVKAKSAKEAEDLLWDKKRLCPEDYVLEDSSKPQEDSFGGRYIHDEDRLNYEM